MRSIEIILKRQCFEEAFSCHTHTEPSRHCYGKVGL